MQKKRHAFTLVELMVVVAIIGILIAITIPATNKALNRAKRLQCASNLKQLSAAVLLYCKDNKGEFPVQIKSSGGDETQWAFAVVPYLGKKFADWEPATPAKERPVFFCPNAMKHHPGTYELRHGSYGMNSDLMQGQQPAGPSKRISSFNRTSATVMMADGHWGSDHGDDWWWAGMTFDRGEVPDDYPDEPVEGRKTFVHEEGANFVYLDGHTEWLPYSNYSTNEPIWTGESPY